MVTVNRDIMRASSSRSETFPSAGLPGPDGESGVLPVGLASVSPQDLHKALQEKVRDLIKLAKEQGPSPTMTSTRLCQRVSMTRTAWNRSSHNSERWEIEIIDSSDVDRVKEVRKDREEEEKDEKPDSKLDILDDPVRICP